MSEEPRYTPATSTHIDEDVDENIDGKRPVEQPGNEEDEEKYYSGTEGSRNSGAEQEESEDVQDDAQEDVQNAAAAEEEEKEEEEQPVVAPHKASNEEEEDDDASGADEPVEAPLMEPPASSGIDMNNALAKARAIAAKLGSMQTTQQSIGSQQQKQKQQQRTQDSAEKAEEEHRGPMRDRHRDRRSASPERSATRGTRPNKRDRSSRSRERREPPPRRRFDGAEGYGGGAMQQEQQQQQQQQQAVEFVVPTELSGLIIGRSGSNLRSIEQRYGVRVQFDSNFDKRAPERRITIEGSMQQAEGAKQDIMDFVDRHQRQQDQPFRPPAAPMDHHMPEAGGAPVGQEDHESAGMAVIAVPSSKVGLIIGRRGESIKSIQALSGARVQVQPDDGRGAPERPIHLIGSPDQIEVARIRIMEIVSTDKPPSDSYGRNDYAQSSSGYPVPQSHGQSGGYGGGRMPSGGGYGMPQDRYGGGGGGPPYQSQMGGGGGGGHIEEMQVPADAVGIIIGRSGETIKHLQQATGTRIQVLQGPEHTGPYRTVTVAGDPSACMRGRRMIEEKIEGLQERMGAPPSAPSTGGGYGGPRGNMHGGYGHHQQQQPVGGGYGGGYGYGAEPMDVGSDQKPSQWGQQQPQQHQQQYYGASGGNSAPAYGGYQQPQQQHQQQQPQQPQQQQQQAGGEQAMQWTNKQTADYYAQYASTNPEYAQYADYYRKLAETDPNGIVPSG